MISKRMLTLLLSVTLSSAARLTIVVPSSPPQLPNPSSLTSTTHAILLGPPGVRYDVPIRRDNSFVFPPLDPASYLLSIHSRDHMFPPLRVDVTAEENKEPSISAWQTFRGNEWSNKGPQYGSGQDELIVEVQPIGQKDFYQERQGFSIASFLKSPMILMALVSVLMIFGLPYLMDNMDPETKAEMEEMQKKGTITGSGGAAETIQNFDLAGWMAGGSAGSSAKKK